MSLYKEYTQTTIPNKEIKFSISFNKSTYNWATSENKKIGYYVTVVPVEIGDGFESFVAFTGFNDCLLEINRQSSKRLMTAIKTLHANKERYLEYFKNKGYTFKEKQNDKI